MNVLLTGCRSYTALDLARRFRDSGWNVFAADSVKFPVCRGSRAVKEFFHVPSPREGCREFIAALAAIIRSAGIDLLLPTSEEIFYIAHGRKELSRYCRVFCDDFEVLDSLHNKWAFSGLTEGMSARTPETKLLTSAAQLKELGDPSAFAFKPVYSRFASEVLLAPSRLPEGFAPSPDRPWIAQRYILGLELCSYHLAVDGEIAAYGSYEPSYRLGQASGYYFKPVHREKIDRFAAELVRKLDFTGHVAFDYIEEKDGTLHVLECNPRATSGLHLAGTAGLMKPFGAGGERLPEATGGKLSAGGRTPLENPAAIRISRGSSRSSGDPGNPGSSGSSGPQRNARNPVPAETPPMIGYAMLANPFYHGFNPSGVGRWFNDFRHGRDVLFSRQDPWVPLLHAGSLAETAFDSLRRRIPFKDAATADIEWDGEALN
ncbi:ATP-grasp domain-containing protein [Paenibacillus chitinolyticus]|uniref:ATP-dependent carboxylate-amine ligase n=1 Tax=Paenibacillus chitinolyticus TaxID=79263 RepID=UPI00366DE7B5